MRSELLIENLFEHLINGSREPARQLVQQCLDRGMKAHDLIGEVFWPAYEMVERLHRGDQLATISHHMATRLLRVLADQAAQRLEHQPRNGKTIFAFCGPSDADELAAQMAIDMLDASGYEVSFAGGGIANDEILAKVQEASPDALLLFASAPGDLPSIRSLIDTIREIGACRNMQLVVGGGVFNRAEGLAEEIGADLWATSPIELVQTLKQNPLRRAASDQRTVGRKRTKMPPRAEAA